MHVELPTRPAAVTTLPAVPAPVPEIETNGAPQSAPASRPVQPPDAPPLISVIVPVRNAPAHLRSCLRHLRRSRHPQFEIIVVDDASTDETPEVAREFDVRLVRLPRQSGPGQARNAGAAIATGDYLLFLDADVCVYPHTLNRVQETFDGASHVDAVFGSYDARPTALNIISQYRNLLHHFVHQQACPEASTFWAGCGAVKRSVFQAVGGFAPEYRRPCIEDIEMGIRLRKAGFRIVLNKQIQVTHLKRWTLWNMLKADVLDRGIPWTRLILRERALPNDLNLKTSQRVSLLLTYGLLAVFLIGALQVLGLLLVPVLGLLGMLVLDLYSTRRRVPTLVRGLAIGAGLLTGIAAAVRFPGESLGALALMLGIMLINAPLYAFFARQRDPLFAVIVFPLQLLYFAYCGVALGAGIALHYGRAAALRLRALVQADATAAVCSATETAFPAGTPGSEDVARQPQA